MKTLRIPTGVETWPYPLRLAEESDIHAGASLLLINMVTWEEQDVAVLPIGDGKFKVADKVSGRVVDLENMDALLGFVLEGQAHGIFTVDPEVLGREPNGAMCAECGEFIKGGKSDDVCKSCLGK